MSEFAKPVLAFESSLGGCIGAVSVDGKVVSQFSFETDRDQAAKLMPQVQAIMEQAGLDFAALGLIVTTIGPGSFTGLRISLSAARAMGLSLNLPVQGISTLEVMARSCMAKGDSLVVLESKREDFYVQAFDATFKPLMEPTCLVAAEIGAMAAGKNYALCGDGAARLLQESAKPEIFSHVVERKLLDPVCLAQAGVSRFIAAGGVAEKPEPLYLRGADVSLSNKSQRQINKQSGITA